SPRHIGTLHRSPVGINLSLLAAHHSALMSSAMRLASFSVRRLPVLQASARNVPPMAILLEQNGEAVDLFQFAWQLRDSRSSGSSRANRSLLIAPSLISFFCLQR